MIIFLKSAHALNVESAAARHDFYLLQVLSTGYTWSTLSACNSSGYPLFC